MINYIKTNRIYILLIFTLNISCFKQDMNSSTNSELLRKYIQIAREEINLQFETNKNKKFQEINYISNNQGVFVRLLKNGKERGCYGFFKNINSIDEAIKKSAINAAFFDPRFPELTENELDKIEIQLTIVGKFEELHNKKQFIIGKDSLLIDDYSNRGILQAPIAIEENYNKTQFLKALCRKAKLNESSYKLKYTKIYKATSLYYKEPFNIDK